jgi:inhibitor of KinA sporulation pathway (predicted exonuclease)
MIIFDIEWNTGYGSNALPEILQIGAVRVDSLGGKITDTFCSFVKPSANKKIGYFAKNLPSLDESLNASTNFGDVYRSFIDWCGDEKEFAAWGIEDFKVIEENCRKYKLDVFIPEMIYDLQFAFSVVLQTEKQIALSDAVEYCLIPSPFDFHNGLYDSVYTAMVSSFIPVSVIKSIGIPKAIYAYTLNAPVYKRQSGRRVGTFSTVESALNSRLSRKPKCPICGNYYWIDTWCYSTPGQYYSFFECPRHGKFPCRLTLTEEEERFSGKLSVLKITPEAAETLLLAYNTNRFNCKAESELKKKRRRYRHNSKK